MQIRQSSSRYSKISIRSEGHRRWAKMRERDQGMKFAAYAGAGLLSGYLVEADAPDRKPTKWAAVSALVVHFLVFWIVIPDRSLDPIRVTPESATLIVKRYQPPAPPSKAKKTKRKKSQVVPIPDPTPDEPEPLIEEESDYDLGEFDAVFSVGIPNGPPTPGARAGAFSAGEGGVAPPQVIRRVDPEYTPEATRKGIQGEVWIEAVVDAQGVVVEPKLLRGLPDDELNERAMEAIQLWEFRPGMKDGQAVPVIAVFTVTFRLH